jgi:hypothetical protein
MKTIRNIIGVLFVLYIIGLFIGDDSKDENNIVSNNESNYRNYVDNDLYYTVENGNKFYLEFKSDNGGWFGAVILTISNGCEYVYSYNLDGNRLDLEYVGSECGGSGSSTTMTINENGTISTYIKGQNFTFEKD